MQARISKVPIVTRLFLIVENRLLRETLNSIFHKKSGISISSAIPYSNLAFEHAKKADFDVLLADQASASLLPANFIPDLLAHSPERKIILFGMKEDSEAFLQAV